MGGRNGGGEKTNRSQRVKHMSTHACTLPTHQNTDVHSHARTHNMHECTPVVAHLSNSLRQAASHAYLSGDR